MVQFPVINKCMYINKWTRTYVRLVQKPDSTLIQLKLFMHIGERRKLEKQRYICTLGNQMSFLLLFKGWASSRTARQRGSRRWSWSRRPCWGPFAAATRKDRSSGAVSRVYWNKLIINTTNNIFTLNQLSTMWKFGNVALT